MDLDEKAFPPRSILHAISRAKDAMLSPEALAEQVQGTLDVFRKRTAEVYQAYAARMRAANALDFDDLILFTVRLLQDDPEVRAYYQEKFRYVLVDEYQDTNDLQYKLVRLLAGKRNNLCVVGDDDQGIYKFRGATIENILSFEKQFPGARVIRLEQNYRSTGNILDAANAVIRMNVARKGKELWTNNQRGEKLTLYRAATETEEAQYVANCIKAGFQAGANWGDLLCSIELTHNPTNWSMPSNAPAFPIKWSAEPSFSIAPRSRISPPTSVCLIIRRITCV